MPIASIVHHVRQAANRFVGARDGNVAVIFGIAILPLLGLVGAALDYSRANAARSSMQAALDSTALMLSKDLSSGRVQPADVQSTAETYFKGLYKNKDVKTTPVVTAVYTPNNGTLGSTIQITGSAEIPAYFIQILGLPKNMGFTANTTTAWGQAKMRVALALDNTGSMSQSNPTKISALKSAVAGTNGFIDQLSKLASNPGDVLISVIPFAKVVNLGGNVATSKIDWTDWQNPPTIQPNNGAYQAKIPNSKFTAAQWANVGPGSSCPFKSSNGFPYFTCNSNATNTMGTSLNVSTIPTTSITINGATVQNPICPSVDSASNTFYNGCWDSIKDSTTVTLCTGSSCNCTGANNTCSCTGSGSSKVCKVNTFSHTWYASATSTWKGCVTDRTQPNDATADTNALFPANQYGEGTGQGYCDSNNSTQLQPIIPLSSSWSSLKSAVNTMKPTGGTNQVIGLAWALQSLIPGGVLNAPAEDSNYIYNRVIILLSDGLNTENRWPEYGDGSTQTTTYGNSQFPGSIDARQQVLCDNLKNAKDANGRSMYTIYTIQVNTNTPADPTSAILQYCASSSDKFFMLNSSAQIADTFNTIGTALAQLRIAQ
jgi:Flp pilus assembly protein TadG